MRKAGDAILRGHLPSAVQEEGSPGLVVPADIPRGMPVGTMVGFANAFSLLRVAGSLSKQGLIQPSPAHLEKRNFCRK